MSATPYVAKSVNAILHELGAESIDVRHVEAYMRLEHGTLDAIGPRQWRAEVIIAVACIKADPAAAEALAASYGL